MKNMDEQARANLILGSTLSSTLIYRELINGNQEVVWLEGLTFNPKKSINKKVHLVIDKGNSLTNHYKLNTKKFFNNGSFYDQYDSFKNSAMDWALEGGKEPILWNFFINNNFSYHFEDFSANDFSQIIMSKSISNISYDESNDTWLVVCDIKRILPKKLYWSANIDSFAALVSDQNLISQLIIPNPDYFSSDLNMNKALELSFARENVFQHEESLIFIAFKYKGFRYLCVGYIQSQDNKFKVLVPLLDDWSLDLKTLPSIKKLISRKVNEIFSGSKLESFSVTDTFPGSNVNRKKIFNTDECSKVNLYPIEDYAYLGKNYLDTCNNF